MASSWQKAIDRELPADWVPRPGDSVWMPRRIPFLRSARGQVARAMLAGYVEVTYQVRGQAGRAVLTRDELRPRIVRVLKKRRRKRTKRGRK